MSSANKSKPATDLNAKRRREEVANLRSDLDEAGEERRGLVKDERSAGTQGMNAKPPPERRVRWARGEAE